MESTTERNANEGRFAPCSASCGWPRLADLASLALFSLLGVRGERRPPCRDGP